MIHPTLSTRLPRELPQLRGALGVFVGEGLQGGHEVFPGLGAPVHGDDAGAGARAGEGVEDLLEHVGVPPSSRQVSV